MKKSIATFLSVLFIATATFQAEAKRSAPQEVKPVIHNGIKYVAPHFKFINNQREIGYVEAWDLKTDKKLWELQIYKVIYNPALEKDVQDIFITSLSVKDGKLIVTNERNEEFEVNLETKAVKKIK